MITGFMSQVRRLGASIVTSPDGYPDGYKVQWLAHSQDESEAGQNALAMLQQQLDKMPAEQIAAALQEAPEYFDRIPLSHSQTSLWFLHKLSPEIRAYHMIAAYQVAMSMNPEWLQSAFNYTISRHQSLHYGITDQSGEPESFKVEDFTPDFLVVTGRNWSRERIQEWFTEQTLRPFNFEKGQVVRLCCLQNIKPNPKAKEASEDGSKQKLKPIVETYLTSTMHHIVGDFHSFEIFGEELFGEYMRIAQTAMQKPALPQLPAQANTQYQQWIHQQERYLGSRRGQKSEQFWLEKLDSTPSHVEIPTDFPRPSEQSYDGETLSVTLDKSTYDTIYALKSEHNLTPFTLFSGLFALLLSRYSGQQDLVIGTPTGNRDFRRQKDLVGYTINPVLLRWKLDENQSFTQFLTDNQAQIRQAIKHQMYPFSRLVEKLDIERDSSRAPLFQHMITLVRSSENTAINTFIREEFLRGQHGSAHDLNIVVEEQAEGFIFRWRYNTALYQEDRVQQLHDDYTAMLKQALQNTEQPIATIKNAANTTARTFIGDALEQPIEAAFNRFSAKVRTAPHKEALQGQLAATATASTSATDFANCSYIALASLAQKVSDRINTVQKCDKNTDSKSDNTASCIGFLLPRSAIQIASIFATWQQGFGYLALDEKLPESRLRTWITDSGTSLVIGLGEKPQWLNDEIEWLDISDIEQQREAITAEADNNGPSTALLDWLETPVKPEQLAYLIYTSGSTGTPKAVQLSQQNLDAYTQAVSQALQLPESACLSTLAALTTDLGHTALFGALLTGRSYQCVSPALSDNPQALADWWQTHPVDALKIVPSHLRALAGDDNTRLQQLLPTQQLIVGGEGCPWAMLQNIQQTAPQLAIFNHYGPTETTVGCSLFEIRSAASSLNVQGASGFPAIGRPLPGYALAIVDEQGKVQPEGCHGELIIAGPAVSAGYLGDTEKTANKFRTIQLEGQPEQVFYFTGDKARTYVDISSQQPVIEFLGRADDQLNLRGYRVEPEEIATHIHAGIQQASETTSSDIDQINVLVIEHPNTQQKQCVAVFSSASLAQNKQANWLTSLQQYLQVELPEALQPANYFAYTDIPRLANGKRDTRKLVEWIHSDILAGNTLQSAEHATSQSAETAENALEELIAENIRQLFAAVLNQTDIAVDADFFASGGDSILSLQIVGLARKQALAILPKDVFAAPSALQLAQTLIARDEETLKQRFAEQLAQKQAEKHSDSEANTTASSGLTDAQQALATQICTIFRTVLNSETIEIDSDFFAMGGDSILSLSIVAMARKQKIALTPKAIFTHKSAKHLAIAFAKEESANTAPQSAPSENPAQQPNAAMSKGSNAGDATANSYKPFTLLSDTETACVNALKNHYQQSEPALSIADAFPLTSIQQGMLLHSAHGDNPQQSTSYVSQRCVRLLQPLNSCALQQALRAVSAQQPLLRSVFAWDLSQIAEADHQEIQRPLHFVLDGMPLPFTQLTLDANDDAQAVDTRINEIAELQRTSGYDFSQGLQYAPLWHCILINHGAQQTLIWTAHHLLGDGWSASLLFAELMQAYQHAATAQATSAPDGTAIVMQGDSSASHLFCDYLAWLNQQDMSKAAEFWQQELSAIQQSAQLPLANHDLFDHESQSGNVRRIAKRLDDTLAADLQHSAQQFGVTLNTLYQGAWALLLARYQSDNLSPLAIAVTSSGRPAALENAMDAFGPYLATLPLAINWQQTHQLPVQQWLKQLQQDNLRIRDYEFCALGDIQRLTAFDANHANTLFVFENQPQAFNTSHFEVLSQHSETNFALALEAHPSSASATHTAQCELLLDAQTALYNQAAQQTVLGEYVQILQQLASQQSSTVFAVLRDTFTATDASAAFEHSADNSVSLADTEQLWWQRFSEQTAAQPNAIAVRDVQNANVEQLTFAELHQCAEALAATWLQRYPSLLTQLQAAHASMSEQEHPPVIAILAPRCAAYLPLLAAIQRLGAVWLPLDHDQPLARWQQLLSQVNPALLLVAELTDEQLAGLKAFAPQNLSSATSTAVFTLEQLRTSIAPEFQQTVPENYFDVLPAIHPQQLAYLLFTSGSTGTPKAVMVHQAGMVNNSLAKQQPLGLSKGDVVAQTAAVCFDICVWQLLGGPMLGGTTLVLSQAQLRQPLALLRSLVAENVALFEPVPSWIAALLDEVDELPLSEQNALVTAVNASALRWCLPTGEALSPQLAARWLQRFELPLMNAYGPAECADDVAFAALVSAEQVSQYASALPIGSATANQALYVVNEQQQRAPLGVIGECWVSGIGVGLGYWNDADKTAQSFIDNPFYHSEQPDYFRRAYKTGDLVRRLPDGQLQFMGRKDFQLKLRGQRLEPGDIEAVLLNNDSVREAVVVVVGEGQSAALAAYVALKEKHENIVEALKADCTQQLPAFMRPALWQVVDALPRNQNGKVDRKALPAPQQVEHTEKTPLAGETQLTLATFWHALLPNADELHQHSDFFVLGGHSLLATRVLARIQREWQVQLPLRAVFENPQLAQLASAIDTAIDAAKESTTNTDDIHWQTVTEVPREQLPLSFAQQRLWSVAQMHSDNSAYNMCGQLAIHGELNVNALQLALNAVIARHEVLRTSYELQADAPQLIIHAQCDAPLTQHDVRHQSAEAQTVFIQQISEQEAQQNIDLTQAPMLRAQLVTLSDSEQRLFVTIHHIACDGWSIAMLVEEVMALYQAAVTQSSADVDALIAHANLPELSLQYADFAYWQRQQLQGESAEKLNAWWLNYLQDMPARLPLTTDFPHPEQQDTRGDKLQLTLNTELTQQLQAVAQQQHMSLYMLMMGGFMLALRPLLDDSGDDIVLGTDLAGRPAPELEPLIGCFVNVLPVRCQLNREHSVEQFLNGLRDNVFDMLQHQHMPLDVLVEAVNPVRSPRWNPLVQALFVMQNTPQERFELPNAQVNAVENRHQHSKFDLALFVDDANLHAQDDNASLTCELVYQTALFRKQRMQQLLDRLTQVYQALASLAHTSQHRTDTNKSIQKAPTATVQVAQAQSTRNTTTFIAKASPVAQLLTPFDESTAMITEASKRKSSKFSKLKTAKAQAAGNFSQSLVKLSFLPDHPNFPRIISTALPEVDAVQWAIDNRDLIERELRQNGAILFRDFPLKTPQDFEAFAQGIYPELYGKYGDLPKKEGGKNTYRSTPYPENQMILYHNESSHTEKWPRRQWFFSEIVAPIGGATPIVDCREMYRRMPSDVLKKLEEKQLLYVRNFTDKIDVSWQHFFKTEDKAEVEARCKAADIEFEWFSDNELQTRTRCPAVIRHPITGDLSFFNQVQLHHIYWLEPAVREELIDMVGIERMPRNVYYGDGSPIEDEVMQLIGDLYEECAIRFQWKAGDVVMVDNMLVAHARDPFEGPRKIVVAMGDMTQRSDLPALNADAPTTTESDV